MCVKSVVAAPQKLLDWENRERWRMKRWIWLAVLLAALRVSSFRLSGGQEGISPEDLMKTMRERADIPKDRTYADALTETAYAVLFYDPENPSDCCYRFCAVRQKEEDYFVWDSGGRRCQPGPAPPDGRHTSSPASRSPPYSRPCGQSRPAPSTRT